MLFELSSLIPLFSFSFFPSIFCFLMAKRQIIQMLHVLKRRKYARNFFSFLDVNYYVNPKYVGVCLGVRFMVD